MTRDELEERLKLQRLYYDIIFLVTHHAVRDETAVVIVGHLSKALERVNPKWWEEILPASVGTDTPPS